jgi:drug/metabolite transporter (DMT)-like permease
LASIGISDFCFEPIEFELELADLLVQPVLELAVIPLVRFRAAVGEIPRIASKATSLASLFDHSLRTWTGLLLIGAVANGLAMALWLFLLTRMDVSQASVSIYLLPFFGV